MNNIKVNKTNTDNKTKLINKSKPTNKLNTAYNLDWEKEVRLAKKNSPRMSGTWKTKIGKDSSNHTIYLKLDIAYQDNSIWWGLFSYHVVNSQELGDWIYQEEDGDSNPLTYEILTKAIKEEKQRLK